MRLSKRSALLPLASLLVLGELARAEENTITGVVRYVGVVSNTDTAIWAGDKNNRPDSNHAVSDAIVYLAGLTVNGVKHEVNEAVTIDQHNDRFVPQIQIARAGVPLIIRNSDPLLHVVRIDLMSSTNDPKTLLKIAAPYAGYEKKYQLANFSEPTLLRVSAGNDQSVAPAYIAVMPHPWATLTDTNGHFVLHNVPPGRHKIYAWHEWFGALFRDVQINGSRTGAVDFQFGPR